MEDIEARKSHPRLCGPREAGAQSLEQWLRGRQLAPDVFLPLAIELAVALARLQARSLLHRDLNPRNVMIDAEGRITLIGFGLAAVLPAPRPRSGAGDQPQGLPPRMGGELTYLAPEESGRMDRLVDHRADLYSLGAIFYEMLTGSPPFQKADSVDLLHAHLARVPARPERLNPHIPPALSAIVLKLLAKMPEARYQSAQGLLEDLREGQAQLQATGTIAPFPLGRGDLSQALPLNDELYGRVQARAALRAAWQRAQAGALEVVLLTGAAGTGKSALARELRASVTGDGGRFVPVQFHVLQGSPMADALRALLPDLADGRGDAVSAADDGEQDRRFEQAFKISMRSLLERQPLVLFLDDLRWIDPDSLRLVDLMARCRERPGLLIVGACRIGELQPGHPLPDWLDSLPEGVLTRLALEPLSQDEVTALIGDALRCPPAEARPLAAGLFRKSAGNPLLLERLLRTLQQEQLLVRDEGGRAWHWDLPAIERLPVGDDAADLMIAAVRRLPEPTRTTVAVAACLGRTAPLELLAAACGQEPPAALAALTRAVDEGLMVPADGLPGSEPGYRFVHDWVQAAAYDLRPQQERTRSHLHIGRLLARGLAVAGAGEVTATRLSAAADQLNRAADLIEDPAERLQLAELNLRAAQAARASLGHHQALAHLQAGIALLPAGPLPADRHRLRFTLHREALEVAGSLGQAAVAEQLFQRALRETFSPLDGADLHQLRALALVGQLDYQAALQTALAGLHLLDMDLPDRVSEADIQQQLLETEAELQRRTRGELLQMPAMTEGRAQHAMKLLRVLKIVTFGLRSELFPLLPIVMVKLMLAHGQARESADAYLSYATIVQRRLGDFRRAHDIGQLAMELAERSDDPVRAGQAAGIFVAALLHWAQPLRTALPLIRRVAGPALAAGEYVFGTALLVSGPVLLFHQGAELDQVEEEIDSALPVAGHAVRTERETLLAYRKAIARLRGLTRDTGCIEDPSPVGPERNNRRALGLCRHEVLRMAVAYLLGEHSEARALGQSARDKLPTLGRSLLLVEHNFYTSLTLAALGEQTAGPERADLLAAITDNQAQLVVWAAHCPENFRHKHLLVAAELERLEGQPLTAAELYEQAIEGAADEQFLHDEALANELAGRFHRRQGRRRFARRYLERAVELYRGWGARAKVEQLEQEFPDLPPRVAAVSADPGPALAGRLDAVTLFRAAETISREVVENRLLGKLVEVCLLAAGARIGALVIEEQGALYLRAVGSVGEPATVVREPLPTRGMVPAALVEHVRRSREVLVVGDAAVHPLFARFSGLADLQQPGRRLRSVLVLPILRQGRFVAALYLENPLVTHAFPADRVSLLHLLSAQIATALDNARLFQQAQDATRLRDEFLAIASHELNTPLASLRLAVQGLEEGALGGLPEAQARQVKLISRQVQRLNLLVEALLNVAQIETGQLHLRLASVDLAEVVQDLALRLHPESTRTGTPLVVTAAGPVVGRWDRGRLEQVVSNLLSNALKFAPGRPIELAVGQDAGQATLEVQDQGPGIDPERLPHIFGRFERGVSVTNYGGLGLGLYIVHEIVKALGGQVKVASERGQGARFTVVLPTGAA